MEHDLTYIENGFVVENLYRGVPLLNKIYCNWRFYYIAFFFFCSFTDPNNSHKQLPFYTPFRVHILLIQPRYTYTIIMATNLCVPDDKTMWHKFATCICTNSRVCLRCGVACDLFDCFSLQYINFSEINSSFYWEVFFFAFDVRWQKSIKLRKIIRFVELGRFIFFILYTSREKRSTNT